MSTTRQYVVDAHTYPPPPPPFGSHDSPFFFGGWVFFFVSEIALHSDSTCTQPRWSLATGARTTPWLLLVWCGYVKTEEKDKGIQIFVSGDDGVDELNADRL